MSRLRGQIEQERYRRLILDVAQRFEHGYSRRLARVKVSCDDASSRERRCVSQPGG